MGYSAREPANTIPSTVAARDAGADVVEVDVSVSADGQLVALHGPGLESTTNGTGPVAEASLEYIKSLEVKFRGEVVSGVGVPTLAELIDAAPGCAFNFDLKSPRARRPIVELIVANQTQQLLEG